MAFAKSHFLEFVTETTKAIGTPHLCGSPRQAEKVACADTSSLFCRMNAAFRSQPVSCSSVVPTRCTLMEVMSLGLSQSSAQVGLAH
jgi:hypothetical protein